MPYPEHLVAPMRQELTRLGVEELRTAADVQAAFARPGSTLLVVNSVCGCAAANARPAISLARQGRVQPDHYVTVFAGQDLDATATARHLLDGIPPSSPSMFLLVDGEPVFAVERRHIEGRGAGAIATDLVRAFEAHIGAETNAAETGDGATARPDAPEARPEDRGLPSTFRSIL